MQRRELPFMPEFFDRYINKVDENAVLCEILEQTQNVFEDIKEDLIIYQNFRYQEGKWTPKELIQHIIDNDRIQAYRSLAFARGEQSILPGYDEDIYASNSNANAKSLEDLLEEFSLVRKANILMYQGFTNEMFLKTGICFEIKVTPLALGFQMIGHTQHHLEILKECYFTCAL